MVDAHGVLIDAAVKMIASQRMKNVCPIRYESLRRREIEPVPLKNRYRFRLCHIGFARLEFLCCQLLDQFPIVVVRMIEYRLSVLAVLEVLADLLHSRLLD